MSRALRIEGCRPDRLREEMDRAWADFLERGVVAYDPEPAEIIRHGHLRFHYIPGRADRPGASGNAAALGLLRPHLPCPFDDPAMIAARQAFRAVIGDRAYHVVANRYPVARYHYLAVRPGNAPAEILPQCLFGADEIEDMLVLARAIGPTMSFHFNSNAGADGSHSGSTLNHWHFQLFPDPCGALAGAEAVARQPHRSAPEVTALFEGVLPGWTHPHRYYRSGDPAALAARLWQDVREALRLDIAFNLTFLAEEGGALEAAFFARAPLEPIAAGGGELTNRFGGWELTGAVVVSDRRLLDWIRAHPGDAARLALRRLELGSRNIWPSSK